MIKKANHGLHGFLKGAIIIIMLGAICLADAAGTSGPGANDFSSRYRIITDRNIFSRQRGPRSVGSRTSGEQSARKVTPPTEESYFVLKGLAKVDDVYIAFFEDTRGGDLMRVTAGVSLARGKITKLNLDSVVYQRGEDSASILVGQTLEGKLAPVLLTYDSYVSLPTTASAAAAAPKTTDANAPASSGDDSDVLKKLMERRKQELGE